MLGARDLSLKKGINFQADNIISHLVMLGARDLSLKKGISF